MSKRRTTMPPVHPGETLLEDFMKPLGLSANRLALDLHVPVTRIGDIVRGRRAITADTALRLARYFAASPQFWMNLQAKLRSRSYARPSGRADSRSGQTATRGLKIRSRNGNSIA
jgi:addiction module HigA family antidote